MSHRVLSEKARHGSQLHSIIAVMSMSFLVCLLIVPAYADSLTPPPSCDSSTPVSGSSAVAFTVDPDPSGPDASDIDPEPAWQPRGGTVAFTLKSNGGTLDDVQVAVCFRWASRDYVPSPHVWAISTASNEVTYNAIVPVKLGDIPDGVPRTALWIVPEADMRVVIAGPNLKPVAVVREIGISSPLVAMLIALVAVALALFVFSRISRCRGVPGRGMVLWLISTPAGFASLSQLQVMLWTFVIGASAVYVIALSGGLIVITTGALVLLGIAGVTTLGSQLHASQANAPPNPAPAALPAAPGAVSGLLVVGDAAPTEVRLSWNPPTSGGAVDFYKVHYRVTAAQGAPVNNWTEFAERPTLPQCTLLGLTPGQGYDIEVLAHNAGGDGPAPVFPPPPAPQGLTVPPLPPAPLIGAGAPGQISGLRQAAPSTISEVSVTWSAAAQPNSYVLRYRRHDSTDAWVALAAIGLTAQTLPGLQSGVSYDISVIATNAFGAGPESYVLTCTTMRDPQWADLIVTGDGRGQVDVTRVQMLFFTVITAAFVLLTVLTTCTIPEIPQGFLILMGLSNGVYVGSKFIPST